MKPSEAARSRGRRPGGWLVSVALLTAGCAAGVGPLTSAGGAIGSPATWESLATPRVQPLPGAPRVSVGPVQLLGRTGPAVPGVSVEVAVQELVSLGLLRRRDVDFVERRRFVAALERERRGGARPAGAPPPGVSRGADYVATATWASVGLDSSYVDVRLADATTGQVVSTWRGAADPDADILSVSRRTVRGILNALDNVLSVPVWTDPDGDAAPASYRPAGVAERALTAFLRGLAAEERWAWDRARVGYHEAGSTASFAEARTALARAARLRIGGTLAGS